MGGYNWNASFRDFVLTACTSTACSTIMLKTIFIIVREIAVLFTFNTSSDFHGIII